jgi:putative MFS transporter
VVKAGEPAILSAGALAFLLLLLRVGVLESGMYKNMERDRLFSRGELSLCCSPTGERLKKYLTAILIALPNWFVIGVHDHLL